MKQKQPVFKIAILCNLAWGGGAELLRLIILTLKTKIEFNNISIYLFFPQPVISLKANFKQFIKTLFVSLNKNIKSSCHLTKKQIVDFFQKESKNNLHIIDYKDQENSLLKKLKKHNINVVLPLGAPPSKDFNIPWLGYIFDFQHKYLPYFFTKDEFKNRDKSFQEMLDSATTVLVNAQAVYHDINKFFPKNKSKVFVLPFCPLLRQIETNNFSYIQKKYNLPENYFIISNQFWIHKDHITPFKALYKLKNKNIHIVCTGRTNDNRFLNYFYELKTKIKKINIEKQIHFLGHITRQDQLIIMQHAKALIQPTLFEGGPGGFSTYEAIALGLPVILSNIPVNQEVIGANINYFKAKNSTDLAKRMSNIITSPPQRPTHKQLQGNYEKNKIKLANTLFNAIMYTYQTFTTKQNNETNSNL